MMTESEFNDLIDQTFATLEYALDEVVEDLDYEASGGVLTVTFDNGTSMVFSRQPPTRQLWLAARSGGFHFRFGEGAWRDTRTGEELFAALSRILAAQAGERVEFG